MRYSAEAGIKETEGICYNNSIVVTTTRLAFGVVTGSDNGGRMFGILNHGLCLHNIYMLHSIFSKKPAIIYFFLFRVNFYQTVPWLQKALQRHKGNTPVVIMKTTFNCR